jgi:hypothetical protein
VNTLHKGDNAIIIIIIIIIIRCCEQVNVYDASANFSGRDSLVTFLSLLSINCGVYIDSLSFHIACESPVKSENDVVGHLKSKDERHICI